MTLCICRSVRDVVHEHTQSRKFLPLTSHEKLEVIKCIGLGEATYNGNVVGINTTENNNRLHSGTHIPKSQNHHSDWDKQNNEEQTFISTPITDVNHNRNVGITRTHNPPKSYRASKFPTQVHPIQMDGNCLFRAFSYILWDDENHHSQLRQAVVEHMIKNAHHYESVVLLNETMEEYVSQSAMKSDGRWGTDVEIFAAATLFGVPISVYGPYGQHRIRWQTFYPLQWDEDKRKQTINSGSMYLANNGEHYEVVMDV